MKKTRGMFTQNLRYFCLVGVIALGLMTIVGTGGGGGGGGGDGDADTTDNSKFYGTFNYSGTETESCPDSGTETNPVIETFTIGSDYSRRAEENYIYIPSTESSTTYSYTDQDGDYVTSTITISGDTIRMEITAECSGEPSPCSTDDILFTFNSSYSGGTISGTGSDADGCQWTDTGSFTEVTQQDNSKFYGTLSYSVTNTKSCPDGGTDTGTFSGKNTIGSDYSRRAEQGYIYIPSTESSTTYSYTSQNGNSVTKTITISGDTIRIETTGECNGIPSPCWINDTLFTFNSSYSGGTTSATGSDPNGCQWTDTGNFTKVVTTCTDADSDGYYAESGCGTEVDLNDTDPNINPGATELCDDSKDNDCDGFTDCADTDCSTDPACLSSSSITFDYAYLQYRTYENSSNNKYAGWVQFLEKGNSIDESDIVQIKLKDGLDNDVNISSTGFWQNLSYYLGQCNSGTSNVNYYMADPYSGFSVTFPSVISLPEGTYTYEATTSDGDVLTKSVYFPGPIIMPYVDTNTMQYEWQSDGSLYLSWDNPSGTYNQIRVLLSDSGGEIVSISLPNNIEELTIPSNVVANLTNITGTPNVAWNIQTRNYNTSDNNNYARGYSGEIYFPWNPQEVTQRDNSKFYGTYNYSFTETESCPDWGTYTYTFSGKHTIGSDYSRRAEENYIYIPSTESSTTYSYTDQDGDYVTSTITISGDTIRMEITAECSGEPSPCSTDDILFTFNSSHSGGTISGTGSDADGCQWTDTGSFTKVVTTCTDTDSDGYYAESGCGTEVDLNDTDPNYQSRGSRVMR